MDKYEKEINMNKFIKRLKKRIKMKFCKHEYEWKASYLVMFQQCKKCGKVIP